MSARPLVESEKEGFAMTTKATTATRCNSVPAAVAIVAMGATLIGCADQAALMYTHEAHARKVAAWCYTVSGARTARLNDDCVHRAWDSVPPSQYWIDHNAKVPPCRCGPGAFAAMTSDMSATEPK
jgi:hypothetical protein